MQQRRPRDGTNRIPLRPPDSATLSGQRWRRARISIRGFGPPGLRAQYRTSERSGENPSVRTDD